MKKLFCIFSVIFTFSCQNSGKTISKHFIDDFIEKYQTENFLEFKNVFISIRQKDLTSTTYILEKSEGGLPVYFVTYNDWTNEISGVNNSQLKEQKLNDYFTKRQITFLINRFRQMNFCLLGVDINGNVFINPFYPNNPAFFLRLSKISKLKPSKLSGDFRQYKDSWYVNHSLVDTSMHLTGPGM